MISMVADFMEMSITWWLGLISFMVGPAQVLTTIGFSSAVALFFVLRWQLIHWNRMWAGDGIVEIFFCGLIGLFVTASIYFFPVVVWASILCMVVIAAAKMFEKLVILSVRSK